MADDALVTHDLNPWTPEELTSALNPKAADRPLIGSYEQYRLLLDKDANMRQFDILMHTSDCRPVRMPADKTLKWLGASRNFHTVDGPPHVQPPPALEEPAPVSPAPIVFRCRIVPECTRFFDSEDARAPHERSHRTKAEE